MAYLLYYNFYKTVKKGFYIILQNNMVENTGENYYTIIGTIFL